MKKILLLFLVCPVLLFAQDKDKEKTPDSLRTWRRGGMVGLNFTQASFTNWAAGGVNSISGQVLLNAFVNYKKETTTWDNNLDLGYGLLQQGKNSVMRKMDDKIDFTSKYGHYAFKKVWFYSALLGFRTQFAPGYTYGGDTITAQISDFLAPGYVLLAAGLDYKPNTKFSLFLSPVTGRTTFVMNQALADAGAFGVTKAEYDTAGNKIKDGQNIRHEFGGYIRAQYKAEIMKNVTLAARCELFSNYLHNPQNIDVNTELLVTMKVNKYISASLNLQALYDHDTNVAVDENHDGVAESTGPRLQFRQVLGIGFSAKF